MAAGEVDCWLRQRLLSAEVEVEEELTMEARFVMLLEEVEVGEELTMEVRFVMLLEEEEAAEEVAKWVVGQKEGP